MSIMESRVQFSIQHFWHVDSIAWYWRFSAFTALQAQSSREIIAGFDNGAASWRWSSKVQFSNGLKRVANIGKPKGMRQSPKSPPPPKKKDIMESHFSQNWWFGFPKVVIFDMDRDQGEPSYAIQARRPWPLINSPPTSNIWQVTSS